MQERKADRGRGWVIHGVALVVMFAIYGWVFRNVWGSTAYGPYAEPVAQIILGLLVGYAVVTTVVVAFTGRTWQVPLGIHGLVFAAVGLLWLKNAVPMWAGEAERSAIAADEKMLAGCLHIDEVRVSPGPLMSAMLTATSACSDAVPWEQVWLLGSDQAGGGRSMRTVVPLSELAPGQTVQLELGPVGTPSTKTNDGIGWTWQVTINVAGRQPVMVCYATPDAPVPGCAPLQGVEVVQFKKR